MNTVKKVALSLKVDVLAVSTQSFKNNKNQNRFNKTYYQLSDGTYTSIPQTGDCLTQNDDPCVVNYIGSTPTQEGWNFANRPIGTIETEDLGYKQ